MPSSDTSLISLANEKVSIIDACNMLEMDLPDFSLKSMKVYCPFGHLFHADEGRSRAFAVYPSTNSAFCFAGCGYFTPVKLIAMDRDIPEERAAEQLLETVNYVAPDYQSRWEALTQEQPRVNTETLAEALKVACARMSPDWEERQLEEPIAHKLRQCLALLSKVKTEEDAVKWLSTTKKVMHQTLGASQ